MTCWLLKLLLLKTIMTVILLIDKFDDYQDSFGVSSFSATVSFTFTSFFEIISNSGQTCLTSRERLSNGGGKRMVRGADPEGQPSAHMYNYIYSRVRVHTKFTSRTHTLPRITHQSPLYPAVLPEKSKNEGICSCARARRVVDYTLSLFRLRVIPTFIYLMIDDPLRKQISPLQSPFSLVTYSAREIHSRRPFSSVIQ